MRLKIIATAALLLIFGTGASYAAGAGTVVIQSIQVSPAETTVGKYPEIIGTVKATNGKASDVTMEINVIASLTRPDNAIKSWTWKKIPIKVGEAKGYSIPKEYDVRSEGVYKIEFGVYSKDMRPLHRLSKTFTIVDPSRPRAAPAPPQPLSTATGTRRAKAPVPPAPPSEDHHIGIGVTANAVNTAGGATLMLWPFKQVGLQAGYTAGNFTTAEGRLLLRFPRSSGFNPYLGVGFASVSTERTVDVINTKATFSGSGVTGALGAEIQLSKGLFGYVEISGAAIDLEKEVTGGGQTGTATVKYSPVTVGMSIVYYLF